jgi:FtsZ-interacting cell division protein ZipA
MVRWNKENDHLEHHEDPRVSMTTRIWGMSIPLFALSIPMVAIVGGDDGLAVPVMVMLGAAVSTASIWFGGRRKGGQRESYSSLPSAELIDELSLIRRSIVEMSEQMSYLERRVDEQSLSANISNHAVSAPQPVAVSQSSAQPQMTTIAQPPPQAPQAQQPPPQAPQAQQPPPQAQQAPPMPPQGGQLGNF